LLVELLFGLPNVLADPGPELHLLIVAKPIVAGSWAISGHGFRLAGRLIRRVVYFKQPVEATELAMRRVDRLPVELGRAERCDGDKPRAVGYPRV
jgi:hypothetical protein